MKNKLIRLLLLLISFGSMGQNSILLLKKCDDKVNYQANLIADLQGDFTLCRQYTFELKNALFVCQVSDSTKTELISKYKEKAKINNQLYIEVENQFDNQQEIIRSLKKESEKKDRKIKRKNKFVLLQSLAIVTSIGYVYFNKIF